MADPATMAASQLEQYASAVWAPEDHIEVRAFRGSDRPRRWWCLAGSIHETLTDELLRLNGDGWDVYAGVNPRRPGSEKGTDEDVLLARTIFADWDDLSLQTVRGIIQSAGIAEPTLLVESGHGVHGYWRAAIAEPDLDRWRGWMRGLIAEVASDPKVKDPARIMRLPGFENCKGDPVPCRIVGMLSDDEWLEDFDEVGVPWLEPPSLPANPYMPGERAEPHPMTIRFLRHGAREGDRNQHAFTAACDLCARGWTAEEAMPLLVHGARACGLPMRELERAVASAYSKPRLPLEDVSQIDVSWAAERLAAGRPARVVDRAAPPAEPGSGCSPAPPEASAAPEAEGGEPVAAVEELAAPAVDLPGVTTRPRVVNHLVREAASRKRGKDDSKPVKVHVPLVAIRRAVKRAMGGGPYAVNGILFDYDPAIGNNGGLPTPRGLRFLGRPHELFAWIQEHADVAWTDRGEVFDPNGDGTLSPVTRQELHASLAQWSDPEHAYAAIELVPHHPPVQGAFYAECTLPAPTGEALEEFLGKLNAATEVDRDKLLAMLLTLVWGGPPGKRPIFILTSKDGRGAGKTATALAAAAVVGGAISMREGEDFETFLQRLLSDDGMAKRVAVIDNLKGTYSSGALEGLVTSPTIQGKRLYHGGVTRPNLLTWIVTANTPKLSEDLARRGIVIELGKPQWGSGFDRWVHDFMAHKRAALIADLLAVLAGPKRGRVADEHRDRFEFWQPEVLERVEGAGEVAASIDAARDAVSSDREQAEDVAAVLDDLVHLLGHDPARARASILLTDVARVLHWEGLARPGASVRQVTGWLEHLVDVPPLRGRLVRDPARREGRRWLWVGPEADPAADRLMVQLDPGREREWATRARYGQDQAECANLDGLPF